MIERGETDRQRQTETERDRQRQRQTDRDRERQTDRQPDRLTLTLNTNCPDPCFIDPQYILLHKKCNKQPFPLGILLHKKCNKQPFPLGILLHKKCNKQPFPLGINFTTSSGPNTAPSTRYEQLRPTHRPRHLQHVSALK